MKLYMHAAACSLSPHIVCRELGLDVDLVAVDRHTHHTEAGENFLDVNGTGYVPVLELDDGARLTEGPAIVQYLADLQPAAGLAPAAGTLGRTRMQSWLNFIATELHKQMAMLMMPAYAAARPALLAHVEGRLGWLATEMAGPCLTGDGFTVADAYLFVVLNWSPWAGVDLARWPVLTAFLARVAARPAVQAALSAEGLVPVEDGAAFHGPAQVVAARRAAASRA